MNFDDILERIGPFGCYQVYHYILIGIAVMPSGMNNMANVFLAAQPDHVCDVLPGTVSSTRQILSSVIIAGDGNVVDSTECMVYDVNYTELYESVGHNVTSMDLQLPNGTTATQLSQ